MQPILINTQPALNDERNEKGMKTHTYIFPITVFLLCLIVCPQVFATTYYVSFSEGNDSNAGTSEGSPWKHAPFMLQLWTGGTRVIAAGDVIKFKSGDEWRANMEVYYVSGTDDANRITFSSYGNGPKPIINGSDILTGFTLDQGTVYTKTLRAEDKHPKGIFYGKGAQETTLFHHDGARNGVGPNEWDFDITTMTLYINAGEDPAGGTVESVRGNTTPLSGLSETVSGFEVEQGTVYKKIFDLDQFIQMVLYKKGELERELIRNYGAGNKVGLNEWDYDVTTKTLYINAGEHPASGTVTKIKEDDLALFSLWSDPASRYITIENIELKKGSSGVYANCQNATIRNCSIHDMEKATGFAHPQGIYAPGAHGLLIENNEIYNIKVNLMPNKLRGSLSHALYVSACDNGTYRYNKLHDCLNGGAFHFYDSGFAGSNNNWIYYNTAYNNETNVYLYNGSKQNKFYNNNFWSSAAQNINIYSMQTTANEFKNNVIGNSGGAEILFHCEGEGEACVPTVLANNTILDYNVNFHMFPVNDPNSVYIKPEEKSLGANSFSGKHPYFVAPAQGNFDFRITSPCLNTGEAIDGLPPRDLLGTPLPQGLGVDIGAVEKSGAADGDGDNI